MMNEEEKVMKKMIELLLVGSLCVEAKRHETSFG
jgi:hypothetical protein